MKYFDLHVHPSQKANLTNQPRSYNAWSNIQLFREFLGILKKFRQIVDSQANLRQLEKRQVFSVVALVGLEKAFAQNYAIQKILASRLVSPLSRRLLKDVAADRITYFEMFMRDLNLLLYSKTIREFNIIRQFSDLNPNLLNLVLSVEGAHSFQSVRDQEGETARGNSILNNFRDFKNNPDYRLHHLTLTHLTRQPACVHCFGVKIKMLGINLTPEIDFQPDPGKSGLTPLAEDIIRIAYDNSASKMVLIDIKHMSYLSRVQFYNLRSRNGWTNIPIVVSHAGVTGTSFTNAPIEEIRKGATSYDCDEVFWYKAKGLKNTLFNPWTINLFDEDIIEVVRSSGLIGVSLDQRIVGFGKIFGEYMSQREVADLNLSSKVSLTIPKEFEKPDRMEVTGMVFTEFMQDEEVQEVLRYEETEETPFKITKNEENELKGDLIFDFDEKEGSEEPDESAVRSRPPASHIDYLANNILHIIKVGLQNGFDGSGSNPNVINCICIGSDLDGIIDAMNFPFNSGGVSINENDWITTDEYDKLEIELKLSMETCIATDPYLTGKNLDVNEIARKVMTENGIEFIKKSFV